MSCSVDASNARKRKRKPSRASQNISETCPFIHHNTCYGQFSKVQSGKMGPAPGRFELPSSVRQVALDK